MAAQYSVFEAKTKLSELLRQVKQGKSIVIKQRGTPVAQLVPYQSEKELSLKDRLEFYKKQGQVRSGRVNLDSLKRHRCPGALGRFFEDR